MADFSITISSSLALIGKDPPNLWNEYNWNEFNWGSGDPLDDLIQDVSKLITNSQGIATGVIRDIFHLTDGNTLTLTSAIIARVFKLISNSQALGSDPSRQVLSSGNGWDYIFPSDATNAEDRDFPNWTKPAAQSDGWSEVSIPSDGWS